MTLRIDLREAAAPLRPALDPAGAHAAAARATWRGRMVQEYLSNRVFEQLADRFAALGEPALEGECRTFAREERTHGALCAAVVLALGGEAVAAVDSPRSLPTHAGTSARASLLRNLLSVGCLSETVAVALVGAERLEVRDGSPLRPLLTRIWSDEVGHARFGWRIATAWVPELTPSEREDVAAYLPIAFAHLEDHELSHLPDSPAPPPEAAQLGVCSGLDARTLFYETVGEVIVPALDALGLRAGDAWNRRRARAVPMAPATAPR